MSDKRRASSPQGSAVRPSPLACTECRKHHVKCDAKKPSCTRCLDARLPCNYLPSRRGGRRKPRSSTLQPMQGVAADFPGMVYQTPLSEPTSANLPATQPSPSVTGKEVSSISSRDSPQNVQLPIVPDSRLVRLYYENFHHAHPILVPATSYEERNYPSYLQHVVRFIGSHYSLQVMGDSYKEATVLQLSTATDRTPCMVQALLLYSLFLCARSEATEAERAFVQATDIALELGMFRRDFATTFSNGNEIEAESLRRTWWELFIVEVFMAARPPKVVLRCGNVPYDVPLPCEEYVYANRKEIPPSPTFTAFKMRVFTEEDEDTRFSRYSSFSYRIEAALILARVLVLNSLPEPHRDHLQAVENALISWSNHLPRHKVDIVDMYGNVDEMLFHAHTTIQYAAMLLHLPRSHLRPEFPDLQVPICPVTPLRLSPSCTRHVHDVKATEASKQLSNLLSMRPSAQGYSPLVVSALVLCGVVQLATSRIHGPDCLDHHCNRVVLVLGCLKLLSSNWPLARQAHQHLRRAAAESFTAWIESQHPQDAGGLAPASRNEAYKDPAADHNAWYNTGGQGLNADLQSLFSPGLLSAYIDPTCSDPLLLNTMSDFDMT
ncbi:Zn(II)2Cys6 transcription factor [Aspergillus clavatus NRRL 1]|uniref:C6 transcription factor, putative n=1 Tax=Aspergillus clavatus (strain ATCC 1007 / CBS 513.65 / DSM 816 / NCTC 3887 / NRRL 1 / QM 1276 / 107) TaxID=344612 RepID=A1CC13_ASPCL|nr:C6 transcription factor, putative [Aspergillus clavatus NRRL 1]EAW13281.1 C6 transcription factor, putative [Aspergillus clavatus NRRL 1]